MAKSPSLAHEVPMWQNYLFQVPNVNALEMELVKQDFKIYTTPQVVDQICEFRINKEFLEKGITVIETAAEPNEYVMSLNDVEIQKYVTSNRWATQAYIHHDMRHQIDMQSGEISFPDEAENDKIMDQDHKILTTKRNYSRVIATKENAMFEICVHEMPDARLRYYEFAPAYNVANATPEQLRDPEKLEEILIRNAMASLDAIDHLAKQKLIVPMTDTPLNIIASRMQNTPG